VGRDGVYCSKVAGRGQVLAGASEVGAEMVVSNSAMQSSIRSSRPFLLALLPSPCSVPPCPSLRAGGTDNNPPSPRPHSSSVPAELGRTQSREGWRMGIQLGILRGEGETLEC